MSGRKGAGREAVILESGETEQEKEDGRVVCGAGGPCRGGRVGRAGSGMWSEHTATQPRRKPQEWPGPEKKKGPLQ